MYYNIKGELVSRPDGRGGLIVTPEARDWFQKAAAVLERGVEVDRTFNQVNRRRQIERGDRPDRIYDSGLTPVYLTLGLSYQKLGMGREALNAFNYMRQLEPENPDAYLRIAVLMIEQQRYDEAAAALIQSMLLDPKRTDNWQMLAQMYAGYGEQARGTIYQAADGPKLNVDHPIVREHFMGAYRGFIRIFRYANRPHLAETARQAAVYRYRMPPSLFDSLMTEAIPEVTPQGLDYTKSSSASK
jgi:tetratricopeptide (TPR) repeat protein